MSFEIRFSQSAIRNCFALALLTVAPVAGATGALDSVFTISMDNKSYQMGEDIGGNWQIKNLSKDTLYIGNPNERYGAAIWTKLVKEQTYGKPLFKSGEPYSWSDRMEKLVGSYGDQGRNVPPGFRNWGRIELVVIPYSNEEQGLNPGFYSLRAFCQGGPPPVGGWWSNEIEFEVLEPRGEEGKAWTLLSEEIGKIENRVDSLEKVKDKADLSMFRNALRQEIWDLKERPYRQIVQRYPNTNCAQVAVKHLNQIYSSKFSHFTKTYFFKEAEEEVKKVVPDSLRRKYQMEVVNEKQGFIKRKGKDEFNEVMKRKEEEMAIINTMRKGLRESQK